MHKKDPEAYHCRVCGLNRGYEPWGEDGNTPCFDICSCCGVEFGYEDCNLEATRSYRKTWLKRNKWFKPKKMSIDWCLEEQLKYIPKGYV